MRLSLACALLGVFLGCSPVFAERLPVAKGEVRITVSYSLAQTLSASDKEAQADAEVSAHKAIYGLLGNECKLLLDTVATECHAETMSINSNVQNGIFRGVESAPSMLNTTSNATFHIIMKGEADKQDK